MIRVDLADIVFNDPAGPDANGISWYITGIEGWEAPDVRQTYIDITGRDGVALAEALYGSRTVVLTGVVQAPDEDRFWSAWNLLMQRSSLLFTTTTMKLAEGATTKRLSVVRQGAPKIEFIGLNAFAFQLTLIAPQPVKLDDTEQTSAIGATQAITNGGDYLTYPVITLTAGGNYVLTNATQGPGAAITITGAPAGTVIDLRARTAFSGTTDVYSTVSAVSVWWALLPGLNNLTNTGGAASIAWRNGWI